MKKYRTQILNKKSEKGVHALKRLIVITISVFILIGFIGAIVFYEKQTPVNPPDQIVNGGMNQTESELEELQPIYVEQPIGYSLQHDKLNITYDNGKTWITVPVDKNHLFEGEYQGNEQQLIDQSFILNEDRAAFLYTEGPDWDQKQIHLLYSLDQGQTWHDSVVTESFSTLRFRKVDFLNENFGYIIVSGWRTMSQEYSTVFITRDGGKTWIETTNSGVSRLIYDGGFVDEMTGFLSYGVINPENPELYVTKDGGNSWSEATFHMPEKFRGIFVTAEVPFNEGDDLAVFVNQGPSGDYQGGKVKGKFISQDNGITWEFAQEVTPFENE